MQALTVPLSRYLREFPAPDALHAFERALLELSVGEDRYVTALQRVAELRKPLSEVRPGHRPCCGQYCGTQSSMVQRALRLGSARGPQCRWIVTA